MTVRDLLELVPEHRKITIKPNGRRVYYTGKAMEAPEGLMDCEVNEIGPSVDDEDNPCLVIWVVADKVWDLMTDCSGKADEVVSAIFDSAYYQIVADGDMQEQEAQKIIQQNRENRRNRWRIEQEMKEIKYTDLFSDSVLEW